MKCSDLMLFPTSIPVWHVRGSRLQPRLELGVGETEEPLAGLLLLGRGCTAGEGLLEMTFGLGAWQQFIRKAKTVLEMEQDRKKLYLPQLFTGRELEGII